MGTYLFFFGKLTRSSIAYSICLSLFALSAYYNFLYGAMISNVHAIPFALLGPVEMLVAMTIRRLEGKVRVFAASYLAALVYMSLMTSWGYWQATAYKNEIESNGMHERILIAKQNVAMLTVRADALSDKFTAQAEASARASRSTTNVYKSLRSKEAATSKIDADQAMADLNLAQNQLTSYLKSSIPPQDIIYHNAASFFGGNPVVYRGVSMLFYTLMIASAASITWLIITSTAWLNVSASDLPADLTRKINSIKIDSLETLADEQGRLMLAKNAATARLKSIKSSPPPVFKKYNVVSGVSVMDAAPAAPAAPAATYDTYDTNYTTTHNQWQPQPPQQPQQPRQPRQPDLEQPKEVHSVNSKSGREASGYIANRNKADKLIKDKTNPIKPTINSLSTQGKKYGLYVGKSTAKQILIDLELFKK